MSGITTTCFVHTGLSPVGVGEKKKKKRKIDVSGVFVRSGQRLSSSFTFHVARGQIKPNRWLSF